MKFNQGELLKNQYIIITLPKGNTVYGQIFSISWPSTGTYMKIRVIHEFTKLDSKGSLVEAHVSQNDNFTILYKCNYPLDDQDLCEILTELGYPELLI